MKRVDRFVISAFLGPFILTFLIVIFALMLQFLWLYIDELVGKGLSIAIILEFLAWGSATLIPLALPIATLLASIMSLGGMGEHNELLALKAAGIPLRRILTPLIFLSFIISIGAFFAANNLIPISYNKIYALRDDINKTKEEIRIPEGIFYDGIEGQVIRIRERDPESGSIYGVMVYSHNEGEKRKTLTLADSGSIKFTKDKQSLLFSLSSGYSYEEEVRPFGSRDTTFGFTRVGFQEQQLIFSLDNYSFQRSDETRFSNEIMSQNLTQLREGRDSLERDFAKVSERQYRSLIRAGALTHSRELDTLYRDKFKGSIELDSLLIWESNARRLENVEMAVNQLESSLSSINGFEMEERQYLSPLRRTLIEQYRKFTLSIACFIFFFIGAPLGALIRKGGLGTPVIVSMLFFVLYWVVDISGKKLATDGVVSAAAGTIISSLVLFPIGVFLTYKATRESALFNVDQYKVIFNRLIKRKKRDE